MTAFDARLNVINLSLSKADDSKGDPTYLLVSMEVGQVLPFLPQGGSDPMVVPIGTLHFPIDGDKAVQFGKDLQKEGEKLPKPSALTVASNLSDVDQVAERLGTLKRPK